MAITSELEQLHTEAFSKLLIDWYERNRRDLPWRRQRDPYKIWVSEIMLQQTRVEAVIPYYERFMQQFPTLNDLANAPEESVLKAWEGLGYYSRARNLHQAVREVQTQYNSIVPEDPEDMGKLPGVGPYTRGAVLSIAYNKDIPAVDGNVMRVISRVYCLYDDIAKPKTRTKIERLVQQIIPKGQASYFNQGLMELGATVCIPGNPRCLGCPVQTVCRAYAEGVQRELPIKEKKKPPRELQMVVAIIRNDDRIWINRRPAEGLLASLWQFPTYEVVCKDERESLQTSFSQQYGVTLLVSEKLTNVQHIFSHIIWNISVYECQIDPKDIPDLKLHSELENGQGFVPLSQLQDFVFSSAHQKIIAYIRKGCEEFAK